jgi:hypothetical protein
VVKAGHPEDTLVQEKVFQLRVTRHVILKRLPKNSLLKEGKNNGIN